MAKQVRIGCGAGFWGDSPEGPRQLVRAGDLDYLILDYLAEITMSILARMKAKRADLGYATDFVDLVAVPLAREIEAKGIRLVTNAGGVNPDACRAALEKAFAEAGVALKIALVTGDDLSAQADALRDAGTREMFSGAAMPARLSSINAYLGALPIAKALAEGADIVLTGRVADSALALGPLMHEFGWTAEDYDRLAGGSLAGHVLECGTQATGGIFTDWQEVEGWDRMGFPIALCAADGSFVLTKPEGTGGAVTPRTVAEQVVYEIGDPARYILPDVVCDFSDVSLEEEGPDRVRVSGAKGAPPTGQYKVSATYAEGYRIAATMTLAGRDAVAKAKKAGAAILARASRLIGEAGHADFDETLVEVLGAETLYGPASRAGAAREVVLRIAARHTDKAALEILAREVYPAATAMAQGITGFAGGRPAPQPVIRLFSCLVDKAEVPVAVDIGGRALVVTIPPGEDSEAAKAPPPRPPSEQPPSEAGERLSLPLLALAHGRSGDKGNLANIGLLARDPAYLDLLRRQVTPVAVKAAFAHLARGPVERFEWPGLHGFNFVLHDSLGGGGVASLRNDPQGKAYAQMLLDLPVAVPRAWLERFPALAAWAALPQAQEAAQ